MLLEKRRELRVIVAIMLNSVKSNLDNYRSIEKVYLQEFRYDVTVRMFVQALVHAHTTYAVFASFEPSIVDPP